MNEIEKVIINNFYYKLKKRVMEHQIKKISDEKADLETFKLIICNTNFKPKHFIKIFNNLPKKARNNISKIFKCKNESEYIKYIKNQLRIYRIEYNNREKEIN